MIGQCNSTRFFERKATLAFLRRYKLATFFTKRREGIYQHLERRPDRRSGDPGIGASNGLSRRRHGVGPGQSSEQGDCITE